MISELSSTTSANVMDLNTSLMSVANAAAMSDDVEAMYLSQDAAASTYATQATVSTNYPTITQATAMADSVREYAETLVEVSIHIFYRFNASCDPTQNASLLDSHAPRMPSPTTHNPYYILPSCFVPNSWHCMYSIALP